MDLVKELHVEMLRVYEETKIQTGYSARRFLRSIRETGGLPTARRMIRRKMNAQDGIWKLARFNLLELSLEHIVIQDKWASLFTDKDRDEAGRRLEKARNLGLLPDEFPVTTKLFEGKLFRLMVNAYERNPDAKKKCIKHYGAVCVVCTFDFEKTYGLLAKGFIEVHHLKPLATIGKRYQVDPIKDLRPVCPNCHAVIHWGGETREIEEVRKMIAASKK